MISRIIQTEVNVIQTEVWIVLDIMRKPNPIIILLYIQAKCGRKKSHAINLAKFCYFVIFWTPPSNNSQYSTEMTPQLTDIEN